MPLFLLFSLKEPEFYEDLEDFKLLMLFFPVSDVEWEGNTE